MTEFRERAKQLARTAQRIADLRGATLEASVLAQAKASLIETGYDDFRGGVDFYTLTLEVPVDVYASLEDQRSALEASILARVTDLVRTESGSRISEVVIGPEMAEDDATAPASEESKAETVPAFWEAGKYRLFLSHPSAVKKGAHAIKAALGFYGVAAFVAHDDIEPTKEWQAEIESALRTMDALAAILTPDFLTSRWCDQEVGVAMGRGKLVVPLRAGADPHGFLGKYQGIQVQGVAAPEIAKKLVEVLVRNPVSSPRLCDVLIERLEKSGSWDSSKRTIGILELAPRLNRSQVARLIRTIDENSEVSDAFGVPERIRALVGRIGEPDAP